MANEKGNERKNLGANSFLQVAYQDGGLSRQVHGDRPNGKAVGRNVREGALESEQGALDAKPPSIMMRWRCSMVETSIGREERVRSVRILSISP